MTRNPMFHPHVRRHATALGLSILIGLIAIVISGKAHGAGGGGALFPGSIACTDWARSSTHLTLYGYSFGPGTATWTVLASDAVDGTEAEILRITAPEINRQIAPVDGNRYYRGCLSVSQQVATGYRLRLSPGGASAEWGIGPHTATITPGSTACGEFAMGPARLRGNASAPVRWGWRGTDLNYAYMGEIHAVVAASVDEVYDPGPEVFSTDACASNTTSGTVTVSFELSET